MQRKFNGSSVTFNQNWTAYRDGFRSATGNDNYWLGLDKVYRLMQLGSVRLRVEVDDICVNTSNVIAVHWYFVLIAYVMCMTLCEFMLPCGVINDAIIDRVVLQVMRDDGLWYWAEYSTFSISDEAGNYQLKVDGYSGDAGNAMMISDNNLWVSNGSRGKRGIRADFLNTFSQCFSGRETASIY